MRVVTIFPTANIERASKALAKWRQKGYDVAVAVDGKRGREIVQAHDFTAAIWTPEYRGYWQSVCALAKYAVNTMNADIVVAIGDDMDPDPNHDAQTIAAQFQERFPDLYGIMQPCGDRQGSTPGYPPPSERICGSPWVGRKWVLEAYGGTGGWWPDFYHFYADELLKLTAEAQGVCWMRPDLSHYHYHWAYGHGPKTEYQVRNQAWWDQDKKLFLKLRERDFAERGQPAYPMEHP